MQAHRRLDLDRPPAVVERGECGVLLHELAVAERTVDRLLPTFALLQRVAVVELLAEARRVRRNLQLAAAASAALRAVAATPSELAAELVLLRGA